MQLIQAFDANQFDPTQGVGSLPIGRHPVVIETSEVKANKANDGGYLQLNLRIIDGPQAGTQGAYRLNLYHSNQQTIEIAHRQLSAICHVLGVFQINDSSQLHNLPFIIEVAPQKNDPQYTEVKKVFDRNGNEPGRQNQGNGAAAQPQQAHNQPQGGGNWGGQGGQQQPQGQQAQWGAQPPAQAPAPAAAPAWGGGGQAQPPAAPAPQQQANAPAWGGGQAQAPAQAPAAGGWQQNAPQGGGAAPWGQR